MINAADYDEFIDHPVYYNAPNRKECIVEMQEKFGNQVTCIFCLTCAYKYLYRAGNKGNNSREQDIEKAKWYFEYAGQLKIEEKQLKVMPDLYFAIQDELDKLEDLGDVD